MSDRRKLFGKSGEERAALFLESRGCVVLERGWRSKFGELDLVVRDGEAIVFVEVKTRSSSRFGAAELAVGRGKQAHMTKAALAYLSAKGISDLPLRFDVVAVQEGEIRHIRGAFMAQGYTR